MKWKKNKNSWKSLPTRTMHIKKQLNNSNLISSWIIYNYISLLYLPKKYRSPGMRVKILAITRHNNRFRIGVATTEIIPYDSENLDNRKQKNRNISLKIFSVINFSDPFGRNTYIKKLYVRHKLTFLIRSIEMHT